MPDGSSALAVPLQIASHRLRLEGDILRIDVVGNIDAVTIPQILAVYQSCIDRFGYLLLVMDVQQSTGIDLAARRSAVEWGKSYAAVQSVAVVGAPLPLRIFLGLMNRATHLLSKEHAPQMSFHQTDAEAQTWLDAQRPLMHKAAGRA